MTVAAVGRGVLAAVDIKVAQCIEHDIVTRKSATAQLDVAVVLAVFFLIVSSVIAHRMHAELATGLQCAAMFLTGAGGAAAVAALHAGGYSHLDQLWRSTGGGNFLEGVEGVQRVQRGLGAVQSGQTLIAIGLCFERLIGGLHGLAGDTTNRGRDADLLAVAGGAAAAGVGAGRQCNIVAGQGHVVAGQ